MDGTELAAMVRKLPNLWHLSKCQEASHITSGSEWPEVIQL